VKYNQKVIFFFQKLPIYFLNSLSYYEVI